MVRCCAALVMFPNHRSAHLQDNLVFILGEGPRSDVCPQLVHPAQATALATSARQLFRQFIPVAGTKCADQFLQLIVLLRRGKKVKGIVTIGL